MTLPHLSMLNSNSNPAKNLGGIHIELESDAGTCESCGGSEGFDGSAVSSAEASEVLEAVEAAFDTVALFVEFAVVGSGLFPVPSGRDDRHGSETFHLGDDFGRVVALVPDHGLGLLAVQQTDRLGILSRLSG